MNRDVLEEHELCFVSHPAKKTPREILELRYRCYRRQKFIDANVEKIFTDKYDLDEKAFNCTVVYKNKPVSAIRISVLNRDNRLSPSYDAFADVLDSFLERGMTIVDPTRFVVCQDAANIIPNLHILTLRFPLLALQYYKAEIGLGAVRKEHRAFYKRALRGGSICDERDYPGLNVGLSLMMCRFEEEKKNNT